MPTATPVTTPVAEPTVAIDGFALTQLPPADALVSVVLVPTHTFSPPEVAPGSGFTVTVLVALAWQAPNVAVAVYTNVVGVDTVVGYT